MKTREEVEALKADWCKDPCWDLAETEGFEEYSEELSKFEDEKNAEWQARNEEKARQQAAAAGLTLENFLALREAEARRDGCQAQAAKLLRHYFHMVGVDTFDDDMAGEINAIAELIVSASVHAVAALNIKTTATTK